MNNDSYSKTFGDGRIMIFNSLYVIPDNSGYYFTLSNHDSDSQICRYLHGQSSIQCQTITGMSNYILFSLRISSDRFFIDK